MAFEGRITGRVSADGKAYELVQFGTARMSIPIAEAHANAGLQRRITLNKWTPLP